MTELRYLLWSNKHAMWWRPGGWGYTPDRTEAGRFSEAAATHHIFQSAQAGLVETATVVVVDVQAAYALTGGAS